MASSNNRGSLIQVAVAQVGRGPELYSHSRLLLNVMLRSWAIQKKHPQLRKVGSALTLPAGARTVDLPDDFGWGMDSLLLGDTNRRLDELDWDEFVNRGGFPGSSQTGTGQPICYVIDKQAGVIRFNCDSDQTYSLQPIYFHIPEDLDVDPSDDDESVWYDNDDDVIEGLIEKLYQYLGDDRELVQGQKVEAKKGETSRGRASMSGGSSALKLAPTWFRSRRH